MLPNYFKMVLFTKQIRFTIVFLLVSCSLCEFQKTELLSDQYFVNLLIPEYVKAEQHLWSISDDRSGHTLDEIYSIHKYFLNKTLDLPPRKNYGYSNGHFYEVNRARLFNLKIRDPISYPIRTDKPDILLSRNVTIDILENAEMFFNSRSDLTFWQETFNVCSCYYPLILN